MTSVNTIVEVLKRLETLYRPKVEDYIALNLLKPSVSDFEFLVGVILSQNTSDKNALKSLNALRNGLGGILNPDSILSTPLEQLESLIKSAGLAKRRTKTLIALANWFKENNEVIQKLRELEPKEIRELLTKIYGIGLKTADVYILMKLNKPTFPIDTHIRRILSRLGVFSTTDGYEYISSVVVSIFNNNIDSLKKLHILLIEHGRKVCKAKKPLCTQCLLNDLCHYYTAVKQGSQ